MAMRAEFLERSRKFLDVGFPLAKGPNKFKVQKPYFGTILESVFRKGYFTLQTMVILADMVENDDQYRIVFGGSVLDLSRRVMEDMLYMEYIKENGKEKYSKQFFDYVPIEQKDDMDFLLRSGVHVDQEVINKTNEKYERAPKKLKDRHNWAGQSVEQIIEWLTSKGKLPNDDKEAVLRLYIAENRKNHTSPGDILDHMKQEWLTGAAERDIELGLMVTHGALVRIGLHLIDEIETTPEITKSVKECWDSINPKSESNPSSK